MDEKQIITELKNNLREKTQLCTDCVYQNSCKFAFHEYYEKFYQTKEKIQKAKQEGQELTPDDIQTSLINKHESVCYYELNNLPKMVDDFKRDYIAIVNNDPEKILGKIANQINQLEQEVENTKDFNKRVRYTNLLLKIFELKFGNKGLEDLLTKSNGAMSSDIKKIMAQMNLDIKDGEFTNSESDNKCNE